MATAAKGEAEEVTQGAEVVRSWDCAAIASLLVCEPEDLLDLLDPKQVWGRPPTASAIAAADATSQEATPQQLELPRWWADSSLVRTLRLSVLLDGQLAGFCECAVLRRAAPAEHRACRICFEEEGDLLDGCACRGSLRFICRDCLVQQWAAKAQSCGDAATALKCRLCHQDFTGRALEVLTENIQLAVRKHHYDFPKPSPDKEEERYKMEIATATQLWKQGSHVEAAVLFRKTIPGLERLKGPKDPLVLSAQHNLSLLLTAQGRLEEAGKYISRASSGFARLYGAEHPLTLKAAHNTAMVAQLAGHLTEAKEKYATVLEARQRVLGPDNLDTLKTSCNLGLVMLHAGDKAEAEVVLRNTLQHMEQVVGRRHPLALVALQNLSLALAEREPVPLEAEALAREALEGKQRALGPEHPDTLEGWRDLATVLSRSSRVAEAEKALRQTLAGMQKVLGFGHPTTEKVLRQLQALLQGQGDDAGAVALLEEHGKGLPPSSAGQLPAPAPEGQLVIAILGVYVAPVHRRKGLGRALLQHCKSLARELNAVALAVNLPSLAVTEGTLNFLERCGFAKEEPTDSGECPVAVDGEQHQRVRFWLQL